MVEQTFFSVTEELFLESLMNQFGGLVRRYCRSKCSQVGLRLGLDEDIVNEVFLCLWQNPTMRQLLATSVQNDHGQAVAIVLRIAKSRVIDHMRRNHRRKRALTIEVKDQLASNCDSNSDLFVIEIELAEAWERFQYSLSKEDREIIHRRELGETTLDISHHLSLSSRTVQRHLERIMIDWSKYLTAEV